MSNYLRYKELYDLALKLHFEEKSRFNRIDQKASWYFSALTLLVPVAGFFAKWMAEKLLPPSNALDGILLLVGTVLLGAIGVSWYFVFRVLRAADVDNFPLDDQVFDLYTNHDDLTIYWVAAQSMRKFRDQNINTTNAKATILAKAYRTMVFSLILTAAFSVLYVGRVAMETRPRGGDSTVSSKPTDQSQEQDQQPSKLAEPAPSTQKPDTSVPLLKPQRLTEGYEPPKEKQ